MKTLNITIFPLFFQITGMVSLYYGYKYEYFTDKFGLTDLHIDFSPWFMFAVIFTTIASLIGAFKAFYSQIKIVYES